MGRKSRAKKFSLEPQNKAKKSWIASVRQRLTKRIAITGLISVCCLIGTVLGNFYLQSTIPISFSAQLSNNGDANFSYGTKQSDTYSPTCGCMEDKDERWRGITFAAPHLKLKNTTNAKQTAYWIMASEPGPLQWYPGLFRPQVKLLRLLINNDKEPILSELIRGKGLGIKLIDQLEFTEDDAVALITNNPIEIRLIGNYPIAAYIPVEQSNITLSQPNTTFKTDWKHTTIRESYKSSSKYIDLSKDTLSGKAIAYPMIDLIGTSVIITDDPQAVFVSACQDSFPIPESSNGWSGLYVIIVESPFSTRISMMPLGSNFIKEEQNKSNKDFQEFSNPDIPDRPLRPNETLSYVGGGFVPLPTNVEMRGEGFCEITILEHFNFDEYTNMREKLKDNDLVSAPIHSRAPELANMGMEFRYPKIPPFDGFNIFGLLKELTLNVNKGKIMLGASSIPIDAPSIVELRNIKAFNSTGNVIPIPLLVNNNEQSLSFNMEATSELFINSVPIGIRVDQITPIVKIISVMTMLIGTLAGLLTIFSLIKTFNKSD